MAIEAYQNKISIKGMMSAIYDDLNYTPSYCQHVELSDTKILAVYNDTKTSKGMAVIGTRVDKYCIEWGTPQIFYNGNASEILPIKISETKFVIVYNHADADGYCIAGTISGTTITFGTEAEYKDAAMVFVLGAVLIDTDKVLFCYEDSSTLTACRIISLSGTTITLGVEATLYAGSVRTANYGSYQQIAKLSTTLAVFVYGISTTVSEAVTISVSGTTCTVNTAGKAQIAGSQDLYEHAVIALNSTNFVVAYTDVTDSYKGYLYVGNVTGTTISFSGSSEVSFDSGTTYRKFPYWVPISSNASFTELCLISFKTGSYDKMYFQKMRWSSGSWSISAYGIIDVIANNSAGSSTIGFPDFPHNKTNFSASYNVTNDTFFVGYVNYYTGSQNSFLLGAVISGGDYNFTAMPMFDKYITTGANEQIEISRIFSMCPISPTGITLRFSLDGTDVNNYMCDVGSNTTTDLANSPLLLKANQTLYVTVNSWTKFFNRYTNVTCIGIKRTST